MATDDRSHMGEFRPDLEGLRGVAILLVLLFHVGVPGIAGGFVGVDVFFVLSGFLITGLLVRERERHGRIDLPAFYSRRARRILPAALVTAVVTLAFSLAILAPLDLPRVAADAAASALSAGNIRFAASSMDYFASETPPSPFLHYWSLGVEEQFYLVWPALLILAMRSGRPRLGAGITMTAVLVGSYAAANLLTTIAAPWAFYSLPTRAWQLALGGLLAVTATWHTKVPAWILAPIGWAGLAAILAAVVLIGPATPYPGVAALLPTIGAAGVVLAGERRWSVASMLALPPLRFLGRISYSLYLVHWPLLVLPTAGLALGAVLPIGERLGLALASVVIATASYRWVEQPFRNPRAIALPARRTIALAGAAVAATIVCAAGVDAASTWELGAYASAPAGTFGLAASGSSDGGIGSPFALGTAGGSDAGDPGSHGGPIPVVIVSAPPATVGGPAPGASGEPVDLATPSGTGTELATQTPATASRAITGATPVPSVLPTIAPLSTPPDSLGGARHLPPDVRPALIDAAGDWDRLLRDGCTAQELTVQPPNCAYGDPSAPVTVALVGDSHAEQWFPALARIARARDWRVVPFTKLSCRFVDMPIYSRVLQRPYTECDAWRQIVIQRLQKLKPDLVLVSVASGLAPLVAADGDPRRQGLALARLLARIPGTVAIIADTPASNFDVPACLSHHTDDVSACATPRSDAFGRHHLALERAAAAASAATIVDLSNVICPSDPCPAVLDGMIVSRDGFHLTATFAAAIAGDLLEALPPVQAAVPRASTPAIEAPVPSGTGPSAEAPATPPAIEPSPTHIPTSGP